MPYGIELGIINQALMKMDIFAPINIDYFLLYFDYVLKNAAKESSKGSAIKNIPPFDIFKKLILPLPPLSEQERIVAKIEEIMPYIEKYGEKEDKLREINNNISKKLKQSILQEAVQGKLVQQDPNDESANVLLEKIKAEKSQLIKNGKIKKDKNESYIFKRDNSHYEMLNGIEHVLDFLNQ
jgi:type I restriction enzyme S subunit